MRGIIGRRVPANHEKRYKTATVCQAIGVSEGSITAYFSNRKVSVKGGLTVSQIMEFVDYNMHHKRGEAICWEDVIEIRETLSDAGYVFADEDKVTNGSKGKTDAS